MEFVKLKDLVNYRRDVIEISDNRKYMRCRVQLHRKGVKLRDEVYGYEIKTKKQRLCKTNDLVIAEMDAKFGGYGVIPKHLEGAIVSSHYYLYELNDEKLLPMFLEVIIDSGVLQEQIKATGSTNYSRVSAKEVLEYKVPYFPLQEQRRIACRYFKLKQSIVNIEAKLANQRIILTKLRQQIIQEAIQGKLTADWRRNSPPSEGWQAKPDGVVPPSEGWQADTPDGVVRNTKNYHSLPYNPALKQRARELRKAGNLSEALFWNQIKRGKFNGLDFDRQKIIGNYIVDFYCPNLQIVIEIDGASHDDKEKYDEQRDNFLQGLGLTVIHIADDEVKGNLGGVMEWLKAHEAFLPTCWDSSADGPPRQASPATPPKEGNLPVSCWSGCGRRKLD